MNSNLETVIKTALNAARLMLSHGDVDKGTQLLFIPFLSMLNDIRDAYLELVRTNTAKINSLQREIGKRNEEIKKLEQKISEYFNE